MSATPPPARTPQRRLSAPRLRPPANVVNNVDGPDVPSVTSNTVPSRPPRQEQLDEEHLEVWKARIKPEKNDVESVQDSVVHHAISTLCRGRYNLDKPALYKAVAFSVRDRLLESWNQTQEALHDGNPKRCYYLSMEFLIGRALDNAVNSLHMRDSYKDSVDGLGFRFEDLLAQERDAGLGNGGLGRLAACYMDSAATMDFPVWGYGLRYQYGIFKQVIKDGYQTESPDSWLSSENPWEFPRADICYEVRFYGGAQKVKAMAYDVPIPGFGTKNSGNIRLWSSKAINTFDFGTFNDGNYEKSVAEKTAAENLTAVLYPNDNHTAGKELRLKQEFFFVSASLQDIIRRFKRTKKPWKEFPDQVAMQLNDTHPTLAIPELQRILIDEEGLSWDDAWDIVCRTIAFTNHTVLPEALECWSVPMLKTVLPRHMDIIYALNLFFLQKVEKVFPGDRELLKRLSIIEESNPQQVRMAYLAVVGSHTVNGVAALHSDLIKKELFHDFIKYYGPEKFINITNGVTPRRWLYQANPPLRDLITSTLGSEEWVKDLGQLEKLKEFADQEEFQAKWMDVKRQNKSRLADWIAKNMGIHVSPDALFDIQVKRIHEYKRQFLNILGVIHRYWALREMTPEDRKRQVPRVVIFGGKAAPGYYVAKLVVKLINSVAEKVNADSDIDDMLKVVFIPDYNVSLAEIIIPASDLSQHISTAGTEASGTSNMKFVLNGGLILGTVDGANIEIGGAVGSENIFMFGTLADKVADIRHNQRYYGVLIDDNLQKVIDMIQDGEFGDSLTFNHLIDTLSNSSDYYLISEDFDAYLQKNAEVDSTFRDKRSWAKKSVMCTASMGQFSSDRAVQEYAEKIWGLKRFPVEK